MIYQLILLMRQYIQAKRETNDCKKKGYFTKIDFTGKCKKQILLAFEAFDAFVANGTNLAPTNEMCNVDEGEPH